jgi:glycosyltransferase involved in cell wall biosynthesis
MAKTSRGLVPKSGRGGAATRNVGGGFLRTRTVAADVPGCSDFVRPGLRGILFKPNSVEELERAIDTPVRQPHPLDRMGNAARQRVLENSTEEIITSQYRRLFAELSDEL